jgi:ornithine cyclodeaminase/alanine dehydrogenase-like protein (mu-crystallin family)
VTDSRDGHAFDEPRLIGRRLVESTLGPEAARQVIAEAFLRRPARTIPRTSARLAAGELLVMPAEAERLVGVKVLTLADGRHPPAPAVQGAYLLFDAGSLRPLAVLDGPALTELRTAAVSALAVDLLAPADAGVLALFGSGPQARAHLQAIAAVRDLQRVMLIGSSTTGSEAILPLAERLSLPARPATAADVAEADLLCCCTSAPEPVFDGSVLRPGCLVVAIGSHRPNRREVDTTTVRRSRVVVETREGVLAEAGDLLIPMAEGAFGEDDVEADLFEVAANGGLPPHPPSAGAAGGRDLVLFKSVGAAFEDLAVADAVLAALDAGTVR